MSEPKKVVQLFAATTERSEDPPGFDYKTLGALFNDLLYQVGNGEDIRHRLFDFAELTVDDPLPRSIAEAVDDWVD